MTGAGAELTNPSQQNAQLKVGTAATTATAHFATCKTLTTTVAPNAGDGTITAAPGPNCDGDQYLPDTSVQLTANPATGKEFVNWTGDVPNPPNTANPLPITMDANKSVTANFRDRCFSLGAAVAPPGSGGVTIQTSANCPWDASLYKYNTAVSLLAAPNADFAFSSWTGADNNTANPTTVTMTANKTVTANFRAWTPTPTHTPTATPTSTPTLTLTRTATPSSVCVSGTVYCAATPCSGVSVELIAGAPLQKTTTDPYAYYQFCNVAPGSYRLKCYGPSAAYIGWVGFPITAGGSDLEADLDMPKRMTLLSPSDGASVHITHPTLTWQIVTEAQTYYTLQLNRTADWTLVEHLTGLLGTSHTVAADLMTGTSYTWQVNAMALGHWVGTTDTAYTFTVEVTATATATGSPLATATPTATRVPAVLSSTNAATAEQEGLFIINRGAYVYWQYNGQRYQTRTNMINWGDHTFLPLILRAGN